MTGTENAAIDPPRGSRLDVEAVRRDFPALAQRVHGRPLAYLDSAASAHKPEAVLAAQDRCYREYYSNVHRGVHTLSQRATEAYEQARSRVARFLGAASEREIVFVRGATEGINLVAQTLGRRRVAAGDEVLITEMEHHSNIVPWQMLCEERGANLRVAPIDDRGQVIPEEFERRLNERTRIAAFGHVSNALGTINPVREMTAAAHAAGAVVLVDGAQAAPHFRLDVQELGCDFYVFSSHKVYGPTGVGALYGRLALLEEMPPYQGGGEMIRSVTFEKTEYASPPARFEAGTPAIAGAIGLAAALDYLDGLERAAIERARRGSSSLRHRGAESRSRSSADRHRGAQGGGAVVRRRRRARPRCGHDPRPRGHRGARRPPLRPAGHAALPCAGHRAGLPGDLQSPRRDRSAGRRSAQGTRGLSLMSDLLALYQEVILDHNKRPRNYGEIAEAEHRAEGNNPLCGDRLIVDVTLDADRVVDVKFRGQGCAISTASASLMTEAIKGKTVDDANALFELFHEMLTGDPSVPAQVSSELGKLAVFSGVREFPIRVKCATLPWHTLRAALRQPGVAVSTE